MIPSLQTCRWEKQWARGRGFSIGRDTLCQSLVKNLYNRSMPFNKSFSFQSCQKVFLYLTVSFSSKVKYGDIKCTGTWFIPPSTEVATKYMNNPFLSIAHSEHTVKCSENPMKIIMFNKINKSETLFFFTNLRKFYRKSQINLQNSMNQYVDNSFVHKQKHSQNKWHKRPSIDKVRSTGKNNHSFDMSLNT